jgi:hypothetical protein
VVFFARPDVLSGLYTLANYDVADPDGVVVPMGSGCSSIVQNPYLEKDLPQPRGIIGMFDPLRPSFLAIDELTFAAPMNKFPLWYKTWKIFLSPGPGNDAKEDS